MSESERRRKYQYGRILIETTRVLDPQFDDAVVYLTGAQIEMLRNVSQYLNRLDTYVTEYNPGYYLAPTVADYDDILEIVADLEEALMGNPNTIWGYYDRLYDDKHYWFAAGGNYTLKSDVVPAGYVYRIQFMASLNANTLCAHYHDAYAGATGVMIDGWPAVPLNQWQNTRPLELTLKEGDCIAATFYGCAAGDDLYMRYWGDMMKVS